MKDTFFSPGRRWTIFTVLALMYILVYFYRVSLAVVAVDLSKELHLTPEQLGTLSGVLFFVYAAAQLPLGPLIDRLGSRIVISVSGIVTTAGGVLFSLADSLLLAMISRVLLGIGTASVLMATFALFSHWFSKKEFGRVSGLMVAIGNFGNLSATAPLAFAVGLFGWRHSFFAVAAVQALVTVLVFFMVADRPYNAVAEVAEVAEEKKDVSGVMAAWSTIFSNGDFVLLGLISFSWYGNYLALQALWGGPYLMDVLHLTRETTGSMLMFTSVGFIVGSTVVDYVARHYFKSYKKTLLAGQAALLLFVSAFQGWAELLPLQLLAVLFFAIGLVVSSGITIYPIVRAMFAVEIVGTALTSLNFFVLMGAAITQQIMGFIIGTYGEKAGCLSAAALHSAFLFPCGCLVVSALLYTRSKDYALAD